ncbi:glycosyltransferase [Enemella sp. A6]|uniref:glycosyltransferase n=1 Tax=Enemella sp. A6 TaxID=3440152 RepID=UPI003EBB83BC
MKILLGSDTYPPDVNGAAQFTQRLAGGLQGRGHQVHIVCPSHTGPMGVETQEDGVTVHRVKSVPWPLHENFRICMPWHARPEIAALLRALQPDVVHPQAHFLVGRFLTIEAHKQGFPLVATNHFMPENLVDQVRVPRRAQQWAAKLAWRDLARVFGRAQIITAPTPRAVELLRTQAGITRALPISCGIDAEKYSRASSGTDSDDTLNVLFVGRLDQEKRVNELIDAFADLPPGINARLEIVGDGTLRERWKTQAAGLGDRVIFHGFVDEKELLAAYARCDVFVMPGVAELQSLVTLEAMSAGKPVIAANAMALPHLVHNGRNGWLYTPGDVAELTDRLATLLQDATLRRRMGSQSAEIVRAHDIDNTLDAFEGLYLDAVKGNRRLRVA